MQVGGEQIGRWRLRATLALVREAAPSVQRAFETAEVAISQELG
jgi:hypothetical protein